MTQPVQSIFDDLSATLTHAGKLVLSTRRTPSSYQQAILDHLLTDGPNLIVQATAGSGKTSLLEMIAHQLIDTGALETGLRPLFLAFNKHTVETLQQRLPGGMDIRTLGSLGDRVMRENCTNYRFVPEKYTALRSRVIGNRGYGRREAVQMTELLKSAVELSMSHLIPLGTSFPFWREAMRGFDLNVSATATDLYSMTMEVIRAGMELIEHGDAEGFQLASFQDQEYAPFHFNWNLNQPYDFILIDEAQDMSRGQMGLVVGSSHAETRIVAVGDASQAIYGFSGAKKENLTELREFIEAQTLPLSVSYRCPQRHVELARPFTDAIEAAPGARGGVLDDISGETFLKKVTDQDMVLCRVNTPLIRWAYKLIKNGRKAHVRGNDVSKALVGLAKKTAALHGTPDPEDDKNLLINPDVFNASLKRVFQTELKKLQDRGLREGRDVTMDTEELRDVFNAMHVIYQDLPKSECGSLGELIKAIRLLFRENKQAITLSSVHRAKGLEADTVYILEPQLLPHPMAESPSAQVAEDAVRFVAFTRARQRLYFVDAPSSHIPEHLRSSSERPLLSSAVNLKLTSNNS